MPSLSPRPLAPGPWQDPANGETIESEDSDKMTTILCWHEHRKSQSQTLHGPARDRGRLSLRPLHYRALDSKPKLLIRRLSVLDAHQIR